MSESGDKNSCYMEAIIFIWNVTTCNVLRHEPARHHSQGRVRGHAIQTVRDIAHEQG